MSEDKMDTKGEATKADAAKAAEAAQSAAKAKEKAAKKRKGVSKGVAAVLLVAGLAVGCAGGYLVDHYVIGAGQPAFAGQTTAKDSDLGRVIGSYTLDGKTTDITVKEAIESQTSLDKAKKDDGTYALPSADAVLSLARNKILEVQADAKNIQVSDDEVTQYAQKTLGSSDLSSIAEQYGMNEDQAKTLIKTQARIYKLQQQIVTQDTGDQPEVPETGKDAAYYYDYMTKLFGDEWDANAGKWAKEDGPFYKAMKDVQITKDGATEAMAQQAYYAAYNKYAEKAQAASKQWSDYVNGELSKASINIASLAS